MFKVCMAVHAYSLSIGVQCDGAETTGRFRELAGQSVCVSQGGPGSGRSCPGFPSVAVIKYPDKKQWKEGRLCLADNSNL